MLSTESSFYIKIENGVPVGNPIDVNSLRSIGYFQNNYRNGELPDGYEPYEAVDMPDNEWFEKVSLAEGKGELQLNKISDVWQKIYNVLSMTEAEKNAKKMQIEAEFRSQFPQYQSWKFSDLSGSVMPPIPCPPECKFNPSWNEAEGKWEGSATIEDAKQNRILTPEEKAKVHSDIEEKGFSDV